MRSLRATIKRNPSLFSIVRWVQLSSPFNRLEAEIRLLPYLVPSQCLAVDVGAHSGVYTYALSRLATEVIAIEPNLALAQDLAQAFRRRRVTVVAEAASDVAETAVLRTPKGNASGTGLATLSPTNTLGGSVFSTTNVAARPLDKIVGEDVPVGFIKIDVEGHELAVLRGANQLLSRWRPNLLIEAEERHRDGAVASVVQFLQPFGYRGFMLRKGILTSIADFESSRDQNLSPIAAPAEGLKPAEYSNNFVFIAEAVRFDR